MRFTDTANTRTADDLARLDKKLDDFVRNYSRQCGDKQAFPAMSAFGGKADIANSPRHVRF
jgi:hypothetical protein